MDQVAEVKSKTEIVDVIRESIELKKAGRNYKGLCPFHSEKTPSFMVSPELQIFKCFGCGESGDVISFLMKHEGMEFYEALQILAERAGVKLRPRSGRERTEREEVIGVNTMAAKFYEYILLKHKAGKEFLDYLIKERGLVRATIETFGLGAAPKRERALIDYLVKKKRIKLELIEKAGLMIKTRRGMRDRFYGRVIFPITNHRGQAVALGGRILPKYDTGRTGKYINSPETAAYHKSESLYGLSETKQEIKKAGQAVVVEGELDMLSSWQAGIRNVVAIKGTALTEGQSRILSRFTGRVILALDSDVAGDKAAVRGIAEMQRFGLEIYVADLGKYKDPDEFARADPVGFKKALLKAEGVWDFLIELAFKEKDRRTGFSKAAIGKELVPVLASIEDKILFSHYVKQVAERLEVDEEAVVEEVNKHTRKKERVEVALPTAKKEEREVREEVERRLLGLIFKDKPKKYLNEELVALLREVFSRKLVDEYRKFMKKERRYKQADFYDFLPAELAAGFGEMMMEEEGDDFEALVMRLKIEMIQEEMDKVRRKIEVVEKKGDEKKAEKLTMKLRDLGKAKAEIEAEA